MKYSLTNPHPLSLYLTALPLSRPPYQVYCDAIETSDQYCSPNKKNAADENSTDTLTFPQSWLRFNFLQSILQMVGEKTVNTPL